MDRNTNELLIKLQTASVMINTVNQFILAIKNNGITDKAVNMHIFQLTLLAETLYENALLLTLNKDYITDEKFIVQIESFSKTLDVNEKEINKKMKLIVNEIKKIKLLG